MPHTHPRTSALESLYKAFPQFGWWWRCDIQSLFIFHLVFKVLLKCSPSPWRNPSLHGGCTLPAVHSSSNPFWYTYCFLFCAMMVSQMVKNLPEICRRPRFERWIGKIPWRREWLPTPVFLPGEVHGQRSLAGYSPWGLKQSDTTEQLTPVPWQLMPLSYFPCQTVSLWEEGWIFFISMPCYAWSWKWHNWVLIAYFTSALQTGWDSLLLKFRTLRPANDVFKFSLCC